MFKVHRSISYGWGYTGIDTPSPNLIGEGGSHAWVEVLHPHHYLRDICVANGWDPTRNRRIDADYLVVAIGRDYADTAPLLGSYVGTRTNTLRIEKHLDVT